MNKKKRLILTLLFICYLSFLLVTTLFTHNYYTYGQSSNLMIFSSLRLMIRSGDGALILKNVLGNVALFVPLGFLLPLLISKRQTFLWQLLIGLLASVVIELCQYLFAARIFDVDDIVLNAAGAVFGRFLLSAARFFRRKVCFFYL